jgi:hypothetical protein
MKKLRRVDSLLGLGLMTRFPLFTCLASFPYSRLSKTYEFSCTRNDSEEVSRNGAHGRRRRRKTNAFTPVRKRLLRSF